MCWTKAHAREKLTSEAIAISTCVAKHSLPVDADVLTELVKAILHGRTTVVAMYAIKDLHSNLS